MNKAYLFIQGAKEGFRNFSHAITNIVNFVLLFLVYIIGIGIVSIAGKLFGKHFLDIKKQGKNSNWHEHKITKQPLEKYYRTF